MKQIFEDILAETEKAIAGKRSVTEKILMAVLSGGHVLLDDVPGVGKTTMALAIGRVLQLDFRRVQFTPDVLPSDIVGFSMYDRNTGEFRFVPGALDEVNILLCDEINRASGRTQSALLEAMEEHQVTVDGITYPLSDPFTVIATQNRIGASGTQDLPFAQLDRFMVRLAMGYPDHDAQMKMLSDRQKGDPLENVKSVITKESLIQLRHEVRDVIVKEPVMDYVIRLAEASVKNEDTELGISPRGSIMVCRMAKAHAFMHDRDYVTGYDVQEVFREVCAHRIILKYDDLHYETSRDRAWNVLSGILEKTGTPDAGKIMA